jgi:hypothetical protein
VDRLDQRHRIGFEKPVRVPPDDCASVRDDEVEGSLTPVVSVEDSRSEPFLFEGGEIGDTSPFEYEADQPAGVEIAGQLGEGRFVGDVDEQAPSPVPALLDAHVRSLFGLLCDEGLQPIEELPVEDD